MNDPTLEEVKDQARRLHQKAKRWNVEVPQEWYVTDNGDFELFIGGLYHDPVKARIRNAQWTFVGLLVGIVGGLLGIAAFVASF